ncbi:hypothetical protein AUR64_13485 [Haloprofundus marisrubri]|uniref:Uncharacterized protein n=1 Tax=Haloprofundus marisrubri TaxID=1514971 RepID=A0A0W1R5Z6_9EURY|nr:hypothetical protein [Haloprofundus marisrubri]KTG08826.1 hypothetical protein AUR64_13485 [Haloprofundus marisrubri]
MTDLDRRPTQFGSRVAVAVATVAALVVCTAAGAPLAGILAVVGVLGGTWAVERVDGETNVERATGSVALVASTLSVATGVLLSARSNGGLAVALVASAVLATALNARVDMERESVKPAESALDHSALLVGFGVLAAAAYHLNLGWVVLLAVAGTASGVHAAGTLAQFVSLQVLALVVALLLPRALSTLDSWLPGEPASDNFGFLERVGLELSDVPRSYWALLAAQVLVLLVGSQLFDQFLDLLSVLGTGIRLLLGSGVLHAPLAGFAAAAGGVLLAELLRRGLVAWGGNYPPKTLGYAAGGVVTVVVVSLALAVPQISAATRGAFGGQAWTDLGAATVVLFAVGVILAAAAFLERFVSTTAWLPFSPVLPVHGVGFAAAGGLLFVGTVAAAEADAHPLVVVGGIAASIFVWDAGDYAARLGRELGRGAETRRAELVHLTGSALVGLVGLAVTTIVLYGVGPASVPGGEGTAIVALFSALAALGVLVWLLVSDDDESAA